MSKISSRILSDGKLDLYSHSDKYTNENTYNHLPLILFLGRRKARSIFNSSTQVNNI